MKCRKQIQSDALPCAHAGIELPLHKLLFYSEDKSGILSMSMSAQTPYQIVLKMFSFRVCQMAADIDGSIKTCIFRVSCVVQSL